MDISDVQLKGSYYQVFDDRGKKISELSSVYGELCGIASDFYILRSGNYYVTYGCNSKKIADLSVSHGEFKNI